MKVDFIRRHLVRAEIEGEAAQWIWEVAVSGRPHPESGMVLSLTAFDELLSQAANSILDHEISSAASWLEERANAFCRSLAKEQSLAWQRLISSETEHCWYPAPKLD